LIYWCENTSEGNCYTTVVTDVIVDGHASVDYLRHRELPGGLRENCGRTEKHNRSHCMSIVWRVTSPAYYWWLSLSSVRCSLLLQQLMAMAITLFACTVQSKPQTC